MLASKFWTFEIRIILTIIRDLLAVQYSNSGYPYFNFIDHHVATTLSSLEMDSDDRFGWQILKFIDGIWQWRRLPKDVIERIRVEITLIFDELGSFDLWESSNSRSIGRLDWEIGGEFLFVCSCDGFVMMSRTYWWWISLVLGINETTGGGGGGELEI